MPKRPATLTETNEGSRLLFCHLCEWEHLGKSSELDEPCFNCEQYGFVTIKGIKLDEDKKSQIKKLRKKLWPDQF